jgi:hypothetical protein
VLYRRVYTLRQRYMSCTAKCMGGFGEHPFKTVRSIGEFGG